MMQSHRTVALIRAIRRVADKEPLVARLRKLLPIGGFNIRVSMDDIGTLVDLIKQDPGFREVIPPIADICLRSRGLRRARIFPETVFMHVPNDTPEIAASVSLLRIVTRHSSLEIEMDIKFLFAAGVAFSPQLLATIGSDRTDGTEPSTLLRLCREILVRRLERHASRAYRLLQNIDETYPVALRSDDCARALSLPPALPPR